MGAAAGDPVAPVDGGLPQPLRVELDAGELKPGRPDHRVAAGIGAVLQLKDAGRGARSLRRARAGC